MQVQNYPSVYIKTEEFSRGTAIQSAPTVIAAFAGRTPFGPTDSAVTVFSFTDFTRSYGALAWDYPLTYAVQQFFLNGGSKAIIVRLFEQSLPNSLATLTFPSSDANPLVLKASSAGIWANHLTATVDINGITPESSASFMSQGLRQQDLFNLTLTLSSPEGRVLATERYYNLAIASPSVPNFPKRLDKILSAQSALCVVASLPATPPAPSSVTGIGGKDSQHLTSTAWLGDQSQRTGLYLLEQVEAFNLLCLPPDRHIEDSAFADLPVAVHQAAAAYCVERRAIYLANAPARWQKLA
jgi:hypothetical protein